MPTNNEVSNKTFNNYVNGTPKSSQNDQNRMFSAGSKKLKINTIKLNEESNENLMKISNLKDTYNTYMKRQSQMAKHSLTPNAQSSQVKSSLKQ